MGQVDFAANEFIGGSKHGQQLSDRDFFFRIQPGQAQSLLI